MSLTDAIPSKKQRKKRGWFHEIVSTFVYPLLLVFGVYSFVLQPFRIPSASMVDTLLVGDFVWVNKFAYGYSKHSIMFSPDLFDGRIWSAEPQRGDVIVFKLPRDNSTDYIKRLIGLPGDRIQITNGVVFINGVEAKQEFVGEVEVASERGYSSTSVLKYRETLPGGVTHYILREKFTHVELGLDPNNTGEYVVPPGHYFMMGDNRDNSVDSRFPTASGVGYVPFENLVGRAERIFPSWDASQAEWYEVWKWPAAIRWDRLFQGID